MAGTFISETFASSTSRHPYIASLTLIAAVTAVAFASFPIIHAANLDTLYLIAILVIALRWGERAAVLMAVLSAIVFDYCFITPRFSFAITDLAYLVTMGGFLVVAIVTSRLAGYANALIVEQSARERAEAASAAKDVVLHKIAHELRAPLTAVVGWVQLLRQVNMDREELDHAFGALENSSGILRTLVADLWDASRAASGKLPVNLRPIALETIAAKALAFGGLGLGLSIVKFLVETHGGNISAGERGAGTRLDIHCAVAADAVSCGCHTGSR